MSWWSTAFTRLIFWVDWAPIRSGPAASPLPVGEHRRHLAIQRRDRTPGADCPVELACGLGAVEARPRGERRRCREYEKQCRCHDWIPGHVCPCHSCPSVESAPVFTKKRTPVWLPGVKSAAVHSKIGRASCRERVGQSG